MGGLWAVVGVAFLYGEVREALAWGSGWISHNCRGCLPSPLPPAPVAVYPRSCKRFLEDGIRVFEDLWWDLIRVTF